jgi:DNA-binding transcriptional ArsR family regulator/hypoxanthine-guanine phosphoribosyltransferase
MKTAEKIVAYIGKNGQVAATELVDYLGITGRAVRKQLKTLQDSGQITKSGRPPKVYYSVTAVSTPATAHSNDRSLIDPFILQAIEDNFLYITPRGTIQAGWEGFVYWCQERQLDATKTAVRYQKMMDKYDQYKKHGLIDGMYKLGTSFDQVALDKLYYIDFYSTEIFGKTKLGQLLLFAKQSQDRKLINDITDRIKPVILQLLEQYDIDGVGFIPPSVKRELQLVRQIQKRLNLDQRIVSISKIRTPVVVPQKTLSKLTDRIINARETIAVANTAKYHNILLIDDAVGSGATLNETARKIRQKGICDGQIIGLAITGSFKGFEIISEV